MARLNEAYRVLGDPARRAVYDASVRDAAADPVAAGSAVPAAVAPRPGARPAARRVPGPAVAVTFPWRFCLVMAGVGAAIVITLAAVNNNAPPVPPVDDQLSTGDCVVLIETDRTAREVPCDASARYRVDTIVPLGRACPSGTVGFRNHRGTATACVENIVAGAG